MDKLFATFGLMVLACGGGGGAKAPMPDAASIAPEACTASSSYGSASIVADGSAYAFTYAQITADGSNGLVDANQGYSGNLNADPLPDSFEIDLYEGFGAFGSDGSGSGTITKGAYTLSGDDLSFQLCGLCVQIYTDLDGDGAPTDLYFATAGSITLSSVGTPTGSDVSKGTLAGSLTNVTFAQWDGSDDVAIGSCTSTITSLSFTATIEPVADGFVGGATQIVAHRTR
jgi:hypothetical protein